jgi:hypothetical protein
MDFKNVASSFFEVLFQIQTKQNNIFSIKAKWELILVCPELIGFWQTSKVAHINAFLDCVFGGKVILNFHKIKRSLWN